MRKIIVTTAQDGKRIDRLLKEFFPKMPMGSLFKAFRKKDVKVNGIRVKENHILSAGDMVEIYVVDNILDGKLENNDFPELDIVFEDMNIMIINKNQGVSVHEDEHKGDVLIDMAKMYLQGKGEYSEVKGIFAPALCHRLDRNTGGLVIIAKTEEAYNTMLEKIRNREVKKYYLCYVKGRLKKQKDTLEAYLSKDEKNSRVFISDKPGKGKLTIITAYKVLGYIKGDSPESDLTFIEVELITGRTHQIRAHFAHIGHPLLGDGKYGINGFNKKFKAKYQALWAYKIKFEFKNNDNILSYLNGRIFEVKPDFKLGI